MNVQGKNSARKRRAKRKVSEGRMLTGQGRVGKVWARPERETYGKSQFLWFAVYRVCSGMVRRGKGSCDQAVEKSNVGYEVVDIFGERKSFSSGDGKQ